MQYQCLPLVSGSRLLNSSWKSVAAQQPKTEQQAQHSWFTVFCFVLFYFIFHFCFGFFSPRYPCWVYVLNLRYTAVLPEGIQMSGARSSPWPLLRIKISHTLLYYIKKVGSPLYAFWVSVEVFWFFYWTRKLSSHAVFGNSQQPSVVGWEETKFWLKYCCWV